MKAIFSPGPSYSDSSVRAYAGWVHILDLYKQGLEELGYEVFIPHVDPKLIDQSSTVSKITSYDLVAASQLPLDVDLFMGPPGYSLAQIMRLKPWAGRPKESPPQQLSQTPEYAWAKDFVNRAVPKRKIVTWVWNNADWWRDEQLTEEYKRFGQPYDLSLSWRWINRTALEMCDHVIACSPWVKKTHTKVVPEEKISITSWGVDSEKFHPPDVEPEGYRILFVGGDPIRKGLHYLLKALEKDMQGCELWIVGCSPFAEGAVQFTDRGVLIKQFGMLPHDKMPEIYQQCHVICIPTLEDGIALAIQEGMACGLVPITSPETAEVFINELSGFKVDYRDVEGIRNYLRLLKDSPDTLRRMSKEARKKATSQTWEKTKEEFKGVIKREMRL